MEGFTVTVEQEMVQLLNEVLSLNGRANSFHAGTALLGALPELDSMAVLGIITAIEDRFAVTVHDDEIDGATFATLGSLTDFVSAKLA